MKNTIGVDISKDRLDVCAGAGEVHRQFSNDRRGIGDLVRWIEKLGRPLVVFEATGAYHRGLEAGLGAKGLAFCKVNPRQFRRFAEATGRLAKNRSRRCGDTCSHGRRSRSACAAALYRNSAST
jgi:transposase